MELFLGWIIFSVVAGIVASGRGRSGVGYFFLSLILSPLVGLILAVALPMNSVELERRRLYAGERKCPRCAEIIKRDAVACRFCGADLSSETPSPPQQATPFSTPAFVQPRSQQAVEADRRLMKAMVLGLFVFAIAAAFASWLASGAPWPPVNAKRVPSAAEQAFAAVQSEYGVSDVRMYGSEFVITAALPPSEAADLARRACGQLASRGVGSHEMQIRVVDADGDLASAPCTIERLVTDAVTRAGPKPSRGANDELKQRAWMDRGMEQARRLLKDPESAQFRGVYFHRGADELPITCGEVNSKNSFGGYGGYQRFISAGKPDLTYLEEQVSDFAAVWARLCES